MVEQTLKSTYRTPLGIFGAFNFALFWALIIVGAGLPKTSEILAGFSWEHGLSGLIAPVIIVVLNGLISPINKARLVYWKLKNPLPGSTAFSSQMIDEDGRIDAIALKDKWGELPTEPDEQNTLWYKMYNGVEEDVRVRDGHRNWLFTRDLTGFCALFLVVLGGAASFATVPLKGWYFLFLAFQYILVMKASRTYGNRFVTTVLAVVSSR